MIKLVGLLGVKGAGKDTAASYLVDRLGFIRSSFAAALYSEVAVAYDVPVEFLSLRNTKETPLSLLKLANCADLNFVRVALNWLVRNGAESLVAELQASRSPRWTLQLWGTEYRRRSPHGYDSYWLAQVERLVQANPTERYVITDVRFGNEADFVEGADGVLLRVSRPVLERIEEEARAAGTATALHPSETELINRPVYRVLVNEEGNPDSLIKGLKELFPELNKAA